MLWFGPPSAFVIAQADREEKAARVDTDAGAADAEATEGAEEKSAGKAKEKKEPRKKDASEDGQAKEDKPEKLAPKVLDPNVPLARIGFGASARQDKAQPIWKVILSKSPGLFLFLGDNIHGDTDNMNFLKLKYRSFADRIDLARIRAVCPIMATWNDHDYGTNDAGGEFAKKEESKQIFMDYFGVPADSPRRARQGVYDAAVFGPPGKQVQVILLDVRFSRGPLIRRKEFGVESDGLPGPYLSNPDATTTLLGEEQWKWLKEQLLVPAQLRLIGSGIQVISEDHGYEKWMLFPHERERLFALIRETKATGVVFLSGGREHGEISLLEDAVGYPLFDVTTGPLSGPTKWQNEINRHRYGSPLFEQNFGGVGINWDSEDPEIGLLLLDAKGVIRLSVRFPLSKLAPGGETSAAAEKSTPPAPAPGAPAPPTGT